MPVVACGCAGEKQQARLLNFVNIAFNSGYYCVNTYKLFYSNLEGILGSLLGIKRDELAGRTAGLQLLLFQNTKSVRVSTVPDHLVEVVNLLASQELIRLGCSVQTASQVSP